MADVVAFHVVAKDMRGNTVLDKYVLPEEARSVAKPLQEELFDVTVEPVTELPEGIKL